MLDAVRKNPRRILSLLLPIALLVILIFTTGVFNSGSPSSPPSDAGTTITQHVAVKVKATSKHLHGKLWRFVYAVKNIGQTPVAGFQLNGSASNLFNISGRRTWAVYGTGVCHGGPAQLLIYWSTGTSSSTVLSPGASATFGFEVNTSGSTSLSYTASWGDADYAAGNVQGPAPSSLPASGPCH